MALSCDGEVCRLFPYFCTCMVDSKKQPASMGLAPIIDKCHLEESCLVNKTSMTGWQSTPEFNQCIIYLFGADVFHMVS